MIKQYQVRIVLRKLLCVNAVRTNEAQSVEQQISIRTWLAVGPRNRTGESLGQGLFVMVGSDVAFDASGMTSLCSFACEAQQTSTA